MKRILRLFLYQVAKRAMRIDFLCGKFLDKVLAGINKLSI